MLQKKHRALREERAKESRKEEGEGEISRGARTCARMSGRVKTNSGWSTEKRRERERERERDEDTRRRKGEKGREEKRKKKGGRCESRSRESFLRRREGALNCEFK